MGLSYKSAGVDIDAADASTKQIAQLAKSTFNPHVLNDIGLFSGFYSIDLQKYPNPVIVTSIDGVGTKLKLAFLLNKHDTVGQDLVNHCVNDIMTSGADPIAFTDYIGTLNLQPSVIAELVKGMSKACKENGCALIGGETAEMPGFYAPGEYDLAGSIIGLINKENIIDGRNISSGDILIGLPSNGLHTNGYSLARKVILEIKSLDPNAYDEQLRSSWGEMLLKIHKSYRNAIVAVRSKTGLHGISHITGGGLEGNTKRLLQPGLHLDVDWHAWDVPLELQLLKEYGGISDEEMRRSFNMGIGLVFVVDPASQEIIQSKLEKIGEQPIIVGQVV